MKKQKIEQASAERQAIKDEVDQKVFETLSESAPISHATCVSTDDPRLKEK